MLRVLNETVSFEPKYVVDTQNSCINETVSFEHPKHMLKIMGKKIFTIFVYLNL